MAVSQHHVSKRTSSCRFGIRSPQQLLVTASLLHLLTTAAFSQDSPAEDRITSSSPTIPTNVPYTSTAALSTWNPLRLSVQDNASLSSDGEKEEVSTASRSENNECLEKGDHVSVKKECRRLLINLNIPENRIPQHEPLLLQENFFLGNVSFSVGNVSSIIKEDYNCKCLAGKQMNVSEDICALSINYNESQPFILQDNIIHSPLFSTGASYIKALSLRNNNIYNLNKNLSEHFINLEVLDLSQNMLHTLNLTQTHFPFLIKLKLSKNKLRWFESAPCNLTSLYIDYNNITDLSFIANFKNLGILHASHNSVTSIPSSISNLTELRCIFLDDNKIKNIAPLQDVSRKNMYRISLSHNEIEHVNVDFTHHTDLKILEIDNNNISYFNFAGVKELKYLDLCNNRLSEIKPTHPLRGSSISRFKLCNNFLSSAHVIMLMGELTMLDLRNNNLQNLEKMFMNKLSLHTLLLSNVSLQSLDFVKDLQALTVLEVDDNNITHFPKQLLANNNILTLNLSNNPLEPIYCPSSEHGKEIIRSCNMSFNERNDNIILDLRMKSKEVNKKMECVLSKKSGKEFLNRCSSSSSARKVALTQYLFMLLIFIFYLL